MSLRGFCGIGIVNGKTEHNLGTLWRTAYSFGADFVFTVGKRYSEQASDTVKAVRHVPLFNFSDVDDLVRHLPFGCRLVGVECGVDASALHAFRHPQQACYLLGAEDNGLSESQLARCHERVEIAGADFCLNVAVAGSIVLYERARALNRLARTA